MKKIKCICCFALLLIASTLLVGCGENTKLGEFLYSNNFATTNSNTVIHQAQADAPEDTMLYIINDPTDDELKELLSYQLLKLDDDAATILLIPRRQNSIVKIYLLDKNEQTDTYERSGEAIWSTDASDEGLIVAAEIQRGPNGQPYREVYIENGDSYASYFFELPAEDEELPRFEYVQPQGQILKLNGLD